MSHGSTDKGAPRNARAVLIAGPTASGKSALAIAVAERTGGVVINADSMQVYRDLRVITARPTAEDEARVPHRLFGHVDASENYSVGRWIGDVTTVLEEVRTEGRLPILVGGTGLYFKALTHGLASVPPTPKAVRDEVRFRMARDGVAALYEELGRLDPESARRITPKDTSRIARALEVLRATGRPLTEWHRDGMQPLIDAVNADCVFLTVSRGELVSRIEARFDAMLRSGAVEEVRRLAARHLDPLLPAMKAHGVPWLIRHVRGELSLAEAAAGGVMDTRRYAKRQHTWFRNQMPGWRWLEPGKAEAELADRPGG
jgi:tRNA dimethylallyltransferase